MAGMDRFTGKPITGLPRRRQAIADVITTPLGTRVLRRDYGCFLFELVDWPANEAGRLKAVASVAHALAVCAPTERLLNASITIDANGAGVISVTTEEKRTGQQLVTEVRV